MTGIGLSPFALTYLTRSAPCCSRSRSRCARRTHPRKSRATSCS